MHVCMFCCSVTKLCLTICNPMDCSTPGFPVFHCLLEFAQTHDHWVNDVIQPFHLCYSLLLLPSIFPRIIVFANELTLWDPMDCSMPGFPVHHQLLELTQTHVLWVGNAIQPSHVIPFSSCLQSFPASGCFPVSQFFASDGRSIGVSASASALMR